MTEADDVVFGPFREVGRKPRRDDVFLVEPDSIDERGAALGRAGIYRVRIARASGGPAVLPGAVVEAQVSRRRGERLDARALRIVEAAPDEIPPTCAHTADCGGCALQELAYASQLVHKAALARRTLAAHAADLDAAAPGWSEVRPAPATRAYRNKMDFTFSARRWRSRDARDDGGDGFALGLFARGRHDKVVAIGECTLAPPVATELLAAATDLARDHALTAWDPLEHHGYLRHAVLRAPRAGGLLVHVVTSDEPATGAEAFFRDLIARVPAITTLVHGVSTRLATVAIAERRRVLHGDGHVEELMLGKRFRISPTSFFQTNTDQAEAMFAQAARWLAQERNGRGGVLWDLYCGGGAIALVLSDAFDEVLGLEVVASAVDDALANASANGVTNARFVAGDVPALLREPDALGPRPDVVVLDPPRAGLGNDLPARVAGLAPSLVLLVSCDLGSAARDLAALAAVGYAPVRAALFDLFPHTPHLEGLFLCRRRGVAAW